MKPLVIVGASSRLYREIKPWIENDYELIECSHKDFTSRPRGFDVVVFALAPDFPANLKLLEAVSEHFQKLKIYVGSTAVFARHTGYQYPQLKLTLKLTYW